MFKIINNADLPNKNWNRSKDILTQEYLKSILYYNHETGIFTWLVKLNYHSKIGSIAGTLNLLGYIEIKINNKKYKAHRLAHLYMTGQWPPNQIDHEDTNRSNNKWENIRKATNTQNTYNYGVKINNKLKVKGVHKQKNRERYRAQIQINGKKIFLGSYDTLEEAKATHDKAATEYQNEFVHSSINKNG